MLLEVHLFVAYPLVTAPWQARLSAPQCIVLKLLYVAFMITALILSKPLWCTLRHCHALSPGFNDGILGVEY